MLTKTNAWIQTGLVVLALTGLAFAWAEPPAEEVNRKPSSYAPAKDLQYQVTYLMDRIGKDLEDESKYDRRVKRVVRDANTIAVLAMVMANHDEPNRMKEPAAGVIKAATELAAKSANHTAAKSAYAALDASLKGPANAHQVEWKSVGDIAELMLQVPELERSLKIAVKPSRFAQSRESAASTAATLAAIAHTAMFDDSYCGDAADLAEWIELCACLRDAAKDVHTAVLNGDPVAVERTLKPLARTCDACHEQFKD